VTNGQLTADDQASVGVLTLFSDLAQKQYLLTQAATDPFENGQAVMNVIGPWTFPSWAQMYPDLKLNQTYVLTTPPVPDNTPAGQPVKTFADAKGLVIYKQASPEQQKATWDFYRWVLSNPQNDLTWFQQTDLPPARDDLSTNSAFQAFFSQHPELVQYAKEIPNALPPQAGPKYQDFETALGDQAVIPVVNGQQQPQQAWNDFKNAAQGLVK
jgi:multiple sugar transport system substrate-binding protein